jgi:hypothetical protein
MFEIMGKAAYGLLSRVPEVDRKELHVLPQSSCPKAHTRPLHNQNGNHNAPCCRKIYRTALKLKHVDIYGRSYVSECNDCKITLRIMECKRVLSRELL